jgi:biotin carboxylase
MTMQLGYGQIVLVGFSRTLLAPLAAELPPGCTVVIEEPDIADKRDVDTLAADHPAVGRVLRWEYQRPGAMAALLRAEPSLKAARAVLPGVEYGVTAAADLAARLGLPGAGTAAGGIFRDKVRQRRTAAAAGIPNPEYEVVGDVHAAVGFLRRIGGRCVVKPSARQASLGVRFVATPEEVEDALRRVRDVHESLLEPDRGIASEVLIESAVEGTEYSVEMLVRRGRPCFVNVTGKHLVGGEFPVELGHVVPGLPAGDARAASLIEGTALLAARSGFEDGILHCEWIVDERGPVLVECAARMPGDEIGTLITLAYDFPLTAAYLSILLGEEPRLPAGPTGGAAIRFLTASEGIVEKVAGAQEAAHAPGVHAVKIAVKPGDVVRRLASSWDRAGYVIACGATADQADMYARAAADSIQVSTRPAA